MSQKKIQDRQPTRLERTKEAAKRVLGRAGKAGGAILAAGQPLSRHRPFNQGQALAGQIDLMLKMFSKVKNIAHKEMFERGQFVLDNWRKAMDAAEKAPQNKIVKHRRRGRNPKSGKMRGTKFGKSRFPTAERSTMSAAETTKMTKGWAPRLKHLSQIMAKFRGAGAAAGVVAPKVDPVGLQAKEAARKSGT